MERIFGMLISKGSSQMKGLSLSLKILPAADITGQLYDDWFVSGTTSGVTLESSWIGDF